jgi:hypothetical protein
MIKLAQFGAQISALILLLLNSTESSKRLVMHCANDFMTILFVFYIYLKNKCYN